MWSIASSVLLAVAIAGAFAWSWPVSQWLGLAFLVGNALYIWSLWSVWCHDFRFRVCRSHQECPSFKQRPKCRSRTSELQRLVEERGEESVLPTVLTSRSSARASVPMSEELKRRSEPKKTLTNPARHIRRLSSQKAKSLDMDHVHVGWIDFLWAYYFVAPSAVFLWVRGIAVLLVRQALEARGWIVRKECDQQRLVGQLLLESMELLQYRCKREGSNGEEVAIFCWHKFPMLDMDGVQVTADLLTAEVNLQSKRLIGAKLDDRDLTPNEALILVWFHTISAGHVKLHALANWGANTLHFDDKFLQRNAVVTTMYNYFGKSTFPRLAEFWYKWGISKHDFTQIGDVFDHGVAEGIPCHTHTAELMGHSELCTFVVKIRNKFMNTFAKHSQELRGVDGEAMLVGTIFHSLDHTLMEWNLEDPLWLDVDSPDFGLMAEVGRFVRVGFVPDVPGLLFEKRYKDAPHPFYQEVYRHAASINRRLADNMDTCIIK